MIIIAIPFSEKNIQKMFQKIMKKFFFVKFVKPLVHQ